MDGGYPATDDTQAVLAERGLDISGHRSRQLSADLVGGADLVLGMTRRHVKEAVVAAPAAWPRTFTLKEVVRRAERVGHRDPRESLEAWLARVADGRVRSDLLGESPVDDILDPVTQPRDTTYQKARDEIERCIETLVDLIWGTA
jgi:protein-tyrosine phosphatase